MQEITSVGVLGAGQMGRGIAEVAASHGVAVKLADINLDVARAGRDTIAKGLERLVGKGKIPQAQAQATIERIEPDLPRSRDLATVLRDAIANLRIEWD